MFLQLVALHIGDYELFICSHISLFSIKVAEGGFYLLV